MPRSGPPATTARLPPARSWSTGRTSSLPLDAAAPAARARLRRGGQGRRSDADIQPADEGVPRVAILCRGKSASSITCRPHARRVAARRASGREPVREDLVGQLRAEKVRRHHPRNRDTAPPGRTPTTWRAAITRRSSASISYHAEAAGLGRADRRHDGGIHPVAIDRDVDRLAEGIDDAVDPVPVVPHVDVVEDPWSAATAPLRPPRWRGCGCPPACSGANSSTRRIAHA